MEKIKDFKTENFQYINYTNLSKEQSKIIWEGRNHPEIRKWMTNPDEFSFEVHQQFIEDLKSREDRIFWAIVYNGEIIGSHCLNPYDKDIKEGELGKFFIPKYLGKGLANPELNEFLSFVLNSGHVDKITVKTLISNERNQYINKKNGFIEVDRDDVYVYMEVIKK